MADRKTVKASRIIARARNNEEFRAALLANPREAIEKEFDVTLPDNVNYHVHQQTLTDVHLVLPLDLSDETQALVIFFSSEDEA